MRTGREHGEHETRAHGAGIAIEEARRGEEKRQLEDFPYFCKNRARRR